MSNTSKLGKGLSSLLGEKKLNLNSDLLSLDLTADKVQNISIKMLKPNKFQPRKIFNEEELKELSESIKQYGILQPIIVRKSLENTNIFEIIAGERRFRAAQIAGLSTVPVIVKNFNDKDVLSLAIIENIQRSDLSVIEEAEAYNSLIKDFNYTQQEVSGLVGKSRSHIANIVRLLDLPVEVRTLLCEKKIDMGHARALINCDRAVEIANTVIEANLNVRETEKLVRDYDQEKINLQKKIKKAKENNLNKEYFKKIEDTIFNKIKLKSKIKFNSENKNGEIIIKYKSLEELEDFLNKING